MSKYPSDSAEMARLVRQADEITALRLIQTWGAKQRAIGARIEIEAQLERANAKA
ncbi:MULTISPECIES: hypothetical protein [unclassified Bradyrhizobium]|uniref:hypothetical protein n=1 Tax=unclassified Bradyrhizobium TaxID=2631580 RepID=UPI002478937F|nr:MULTISPECIES: hypothetical protein [unclassified Bradyrhizobium]WGR74313.1 hypothetical protein MTX24_16445 [Bradyrhizobium sp. ISRA426]WGR79148.1 hypothetical protein MTX21_01560 [Bradyrhizobium sp. ISRA430]WGR90636.1 hypothetical protein MTX25_39705 [Bradyrhizobium sp. ISRA432]